MNDLSRHLTEPGTITVVVLVIFIILIVAIYFFVKDLIEKRKESYRRISMMTNIDELTHLYKKKFFHSLFESELERAKRYERNLCCAIIEIDNFNEIKDKYGEKFCDLVLQDIGEIFTDDTRVHDICARYGDYSFASLMPESNMESAMIVCKRLRGLIEGCKFNIEDTNEAVRVTVSIGLASSKEFFQDEDINPDKILEIANKALHLAKENGGNRVECFTGNT